MRQSDGGRWRGHSTRSQHPALLRPTPIPAIATVTPCPRFAPCSPIVFGDALLPHFYRSCLVLHHACSAHTLSTSCSWEPHVPTDTPGVYSSVFPGPTGREVVWLVVNIDQQQHTVMRSGSCDVLFASSLAFVCVYVVGAQYDAGSPVRNNLL